MALASATLMRRCKQLEAGPALRVERRDLPIDNRLPRVHVMRQDRKLRILLVHHIAVARNHPQLAGFDEANRADAVPFHFVDPVVARRRLAFAEFGQHRSDDLRHVSSGFRPRSALFFDEPADRRRVRGRSLPACAR